ncbi:MAG TPA: hypothetical protein DCF63_02580, partial [Planctomycetaceae bacterium]|nr:hypothetical protein [Planctomycetaceae bacterium]
MRILSLLADAVVAIHLTYILVVIVGLLAIVTGRLLGWQWSYNGWFRAIHLLMILVVAVESWLDITCPLTTLEDWLRAQSGQNATEGTFVGRMMHDLLFYNAPSWIFTVSYSLFAVTVLLTILLIPPRWHRYYMLPIKKVQNSGGGIRTPDTRI